jgi:hypothetical protein
MSLSSCGRFGQPNHALGPAPDNAKWTARFIATTCEAGSSRPYPAVLCVRRPAHLFQNHLEANRLELSAVQAPAPHMIRGRVTKKPRLKLDSSELELDKSAGKITKIRFDAD